MKNNVYFAVVVYFFVFPDITTKTRVDGCMVAMAITIPVGCTMVLAVAVLVVIRQCMLASRIKLFWRNRRTTYDVYDGVYDYILPTVKFCSNAF